MPRRICGYTRGRGATGASSGVTGEVGAACDPRHFDVTHWVHGSTQQIRIHPVTGGRLNHGERHGVRCIHNNESWIGNPVRGIRNGLMMAM